MLRFLIFMVFFGSFCGCMPLPEETVTLSFWTDIEVDEVEFNSLYINDIYVGELKEGHDNPDCGEVGLLNYDMKMSEDLHLTIRNAADESVDIGVVNLFSISTGIKIKPANNAEIFVDHSLDDECTLVYMKWK